jgi:hypothetical protein
MADWGLFRWLAGKVLRLPPRQARRVSVTKDIPVPMRDGVALLADHHHAGGDASGPVVLMRSPYGRSALFGTMAALLAERGLQVVVQSVRGTGGSIGDFEPMRRTGTLPIFTPASVMSTSAVGPCRWSTVIFACGLASLPPAPPANVRSPLRAGRRPIVLRATTGAV